MIKLKYKDIVNDEIHFYRGKTSLTDPDQEPIKAKLLPEMKHIIKKYGNQRKDGYIFKFLTHNTTPTEERKIVQNVTRLINKRTQKIGEALGYGNITSYSCRHSFASILKNNNVNISFISEALGHKNMATTKSYLADFDEEARANIASLLTNDK
jgi:integrase